MCLAGISECESPSLGVGKVGWLLGREIRETEGVYIHPLETENLAHDRPDPAMLHLVLHLALPQLGTDQLTPCGDNCITERLLSSC